MTTLTEMERKAMRACLKAFGQAAGQIGFERPLGSYSEAEALQVIEAIALCWSQQMAAQHETNKYPPTRSLADLDDDYPF